MYGSPRTMVNQDPGYVNEGAPERRFLGEEYHDKEVTHQMARRHRGRKMGHKRGRHKRRSMV